VLVCKNNCKLIRESASTAFDSWFYFFSFPPPPPLPPSPTFPGKFF
jgi:hypothetical protein